MLWKISDLGLVGVSRKHGYRDSVNLEEELIKSFADRGTADLFHGISSAAARRIPADLRRRALRKLDVLNAATTLEDLRVPPSNHLEKLSGALAGHRSLRISGKWRLVFRWQRGDAFAVRIVDYH